MAPLTTQLDHNEVDANDSPASNSIPMENYGATEDHEQSSLISGLTISTIHMEEETHASNTVASSLISNASSTSHYFQQQQQNQKQPSHTPSDSLDYSTTSSTNSIPPPIHLSHGQVPTPRSYLGSIVRSLGHQQAFPSSMFPGQKLISPVSSRETLQGGFFRNSGNTTPSPSSSRAYPSYYYFPTAKDSTSGSITTCSSPHGSLPLSYQNSMVSKNVYQKRPKPGFCHDDEFDLDEVEDGSRLSSWRKCWRCFFSPRVMVTLLVCGVIVFNLLRLGSEQHQHFEQSSSIRGKGTNSSRSSSRSHRSSSKSISAIDADYVKLEVIGGVAKNNFD